MTTWRFWRSAWSVIVTHPFWSWWSFCKAPVQVAREITAHLKELLFPWVIPDGEEPCARTLKFLAEFSRWGSEQFCRSCGMGGKATGLLFAFQPSPQKCLLFVYDTAHHVVRATEFASASHIWKWSEVEMGAVGWTTLWKCGSVIWGLAFRSYVSINW